MLYGMLRRCQSPIWLSPNVLIHLPRGLGYNLGAAEHQSLLRRSLSVRVPSVHSYHSYLLLVVLVLTVSDNPRSQWLSRRLTC
jgi:hypothetical protein